MPAQLKRTVFLLAISAGFLALNSPTYVAAASTIYRCGPEDSQWFSQIPCEEDSAAVILEDRHMFNEAGEEQPAAEETDVEAAAAASNAQAFITQLEKQRSEQLAEIDLKIQELENGTEAVSNSAAESAESDAEANTEFGSANGKESNPDGASSGEDEDAESARLLDDLRDTRESIVSEYDAMIDAARQSAKNL